MTEFILENEEDTQRLGELIAKYLETPLVCFLEGDLGVGKTRITRAIIQSLGYQGNVKSPTYTLVEPYQLENMKVYHFDLYRLSDPEELDFLGIRDYFDDESVSFIEWPSKGEGWLPEADLVISLIFKQQGRICQLQENTKAGARLIRKLKENI